MHSGLGTVLRMLTGRMKVMPGLHHPSVCIIVSSRELFAPLEIIQFVVIQVEAGAIVAAGALVTPGTVVPTGTPPALHSVDMGIVPNPATLLRGSKCGRGCSWVVPKRPMNAMNTGFLSCGSAHAEEFG